MSTRSQFRFFISAALILVILVSGGCIYMRLLALKGQLKQFDRFVEVKEDKVNQSLIFIFKKPILLDKDLDKFLAVEPSYTEKLNEKETRRVYHFNNLQPNAGEDEGDFPIIVGIVIINGKMQRIEWPERLLTYIPRDMFISIFHIIGRADVDREKKSLSASEKTDEVVEEEPVFINMAQTINMLGQPYSRQETDNEIILQYRYRLESEKEAISDERGTGVFIFDKEGKFLSMKLNFSKYLTISVQGRPEPSPVIDENTNQIPAHQSEHPPNN
ncbi:hypothetical protein ES707_16523 [subsurface metagenome]